MIPNGDPTLDPPSCTSLADNPFCTPMWDLPIDGHSLGYCEANARNNPDVNGNMFLPSVSGMGAPHSLPHCPSDTGFIERATRFPCFGSENLVEMANPLSAPGGLSPYFRSLGFIEESMQLQMDEMDVNEVSQEAFKNDKINENLSGNDSEEAEFSGQCVQEESSSKWLGSKKRKRGTQGDKGNESNEALQPSIEMSKDNAKIKRKGDKKGTSISKDGGKNVKEGSQGSDPPKEEYMHIRARRGQATNSHSLAERVRREKISERMTFLQDLVPGCSKVTGKAVMLDEIINYVQSLQRQVEFLSMKLATVNPCLDFNIEGLLAKDILQHRGSMSPSLAFPSEMTMHFPLLHHPTPPAVIRANNSSESLPTPINLQSVAVSIGFSEPTSQVLSAWEEELHNIVHMGVDSSAPLPSQDIIGTLPPAHTKAEP